MNFAKAMGIIAVVVGHAKSPFAHFIYLFHMPLFFFISGYFYKDDYSKNPILLIGKRLKSLYWPYLKYELLFILLHNLFFTIHLYHPKYQLVYSLADYGKALVSALTFKVGEPLLAPFWFIGSLFITNIIFCLISYSSEKYSMEKAEYLRGGMVVILFVVGYYLSNAGINIPRANTALVAVLTFYLGYLYNKHENSISINGLVAACSLAILIVNSFRGFVDMKTNTYSSPGFFVINAMAGIYLVIYLSKLYAKFGKGNKLIQYIGCNTMPIMALHFLSFKLIALIQIKLYRLPMDALAIVDPLVGTKGWWIAYSLVGIILPLVFKVTINDVSNKTKQLLGRKEKAWIRV